MVIVVKTQIEKMYALPNTPYNYKISNNISLLFYKCHCLDLRFQTTPFRGWCSRSQILLYLELYNLETLQPKLHYLYSQFLRNMIWMGHQAECESSKSMFPTFDPHQLLARLSTLGKQQARRWRHGSRLLRWVVDDARRSAGGMAAAYLGGLWTMSWANISPIKVQVKRQRTPLFLYYSKRQHHKNEELHYCSLTNKTRSTVS